MMNFTLIRGQWRRGSDRVSPNTVRALHARGVCRLWIPITPETADALGWGPKATAREWHRFQFFGATAADGTLMEASFAVGGSGPLLNVPVAPWADGGADNEGCTVFRLYARIPHPESYGVIGAAKRGGSPGGWHWEVAPRVGVPAIVVEQGGVEVARYEIPDYVRNAAENAIHERIGADLAAIDPAAWEAP